MNTLEIPELKKKITYPSSWEECDSDQVLYIFRQAVMLLAGKISLIDFKLSVFLNLSKIQISHPDIADRVLSAEQRVTKYDNIYRACQTVDFMFSQEGEDPIFDYFCLSCQIPFLKVGWQKWFPPAAAFTDMCFGEYRMAADMFQAYKNNKTLAGECLLSVLFRPRGGKYYERIPFDANECYRRARRLKRIPDELKLYVSAWFACCDRYLKSGDIELEGRIYNLSCLFSSVSEEYDPTESERSGNLGLTGIQLALAESGTFGNVNEVDKANLYMVLFKLYQWYTENKKTKKNDKH